MDSYANGNLLNDRTNGINLMTILFLFLFSIFQRIFEISNPLLIEQMLFQFFHLFEMLAIGVTVTRRKDREPLAGKFCTTIFKLFLINRGK